MSKKYILLLGTILICIFCTLAQAQAPKSEKEDSQRQQSKALTPVLQAQMENLQSKFDQLAKVKKELPKHTKQLKNDTQRLIPYLESLIRLKSFMRNNFKENIILKRNLDRLEKELQKSARTLENQKKVLKSIQDSFKAQKNDIEQHFKLSPIIEIDEYLHKNLQKIKNAIDQSEKLQEQINIALQPAREFSQKIEELKLELEKEWTQVWKKYYLQASTSIFDTHPKKLINQISGWWSDFPVYFTFFLLGEVNWHIFVVYLCTFTIFFFGILCGLCLWLKKYVQLVKLNHFWFAFFLISFSFAILIASASSQAGFFSVIFNTLFQIVLSLGLVQFFWPLRCAILAPEEKIKNPLFGFWMLFSLSLIFQTLTMPLIFLELIWFILLISSTIWFAKRKYYTMAPLEKYMYNISLVLIPFFAFLGLGGWIHFSLLLISFWFVLCLSILFGNIASKLLTLRAKKLPETNWGYLGHGIYQGIGVPIFWFVALSILAIWLGLNLGGFEYFKHLSALKIGWGKISVNLFRLLLIVGGFYLARSVLVFLKSILQSFSQPKGQLEPGTISTMQTLLVYIIWAMFIIIALALLGVNLTSLTVIAGGLSVGIGFGLQSIVNNFISGLILLFGRSIQPGDIIQVGELWAEVKEVNIRSTVVETFDRSTILMPNSQVIGEQIINWTHKDRTLRKKITVGVAYGSDIKLVKEVLLQTARSHPNVLTYPEPFVRFTDFADSSLNFTLYFYSTIDFGWMAESDLRFEIDQIFRENNIEISFPQRDLHLKTARGLEGYIKKPQTEN